MTLFDDVTDGSGRGDLMTVAGLVGLQAIPKVGPNRAVAIAKHFRDRELLVDCSPSDLRQVVGLVGEEIHPYVKGLSIHLEFPEEIKAVCAFDDNWPDWAETAPQSPVVLFYRGSLPDDPCVAVVGTREPTRFGLAVVDKVVASAARMHFGVVSGLARGIDAAAHGAALRNGARTWAILGSGVDVPSPRENRQLAEEILENGGGLVSEFVPGTEPNPQRLVSRNRLQVAASRLIVVAQSGVGGGTMHTARFALEQARTLVVVRPEAPWDAEPQSAGNMELTDPGGCDPRILNATGKLADRLRRRAPMADVVLRRGEDIDALWVEIDG